MTDDFLTPAERAAMGEADGYLSRNRPYLARKQRERRALAVRIDYCPSRAALAIIEAARAKLPGGSNGAMLDAIVQAWGEWAGIYIQPKQRPHSPGKAARRGAAHDFANLPAWMLPPKPARVRCGAKRHRDGQPCRAWSEPGKRRCKFHGGRSTGPTSEAGKARALANLKVGRNK